MNQFVQRVANYIANEVLIKGLANSKTFQKFAVRTDSTIQKVKKEGAQKLEMTFEEMTNQAAAAGTEAGGSAAAAGGGGGGKPIPPKSGVAGFMSAFAKEVKDDFGGGGGSGKV